MKNTVKTLKEILPPDELSPGPDWNIYSIQNDECLSYIALNDRVKEAIVIDPKREDLETYLKIINPALSDYLWLGVIDTHTHADHISAASELSLRLKTPLIMHHLSPSQRVDIRISRATSLPTHASPLRFIPTPGHTQDAMSVIWGPFIFSGDTVVYGDIGRDDLPGGDPKAHYQSIQLLKSLVSPTLILLPGHNNGPLTLAQKWDQQLHANSSLTQSEDEFIKEAGAFEGASPKLLKQALRENFK